MAVEIWQYLCRYSVKKFIKLSSLNVINRFTLGKVWYLWKIYFQTNDNTSENVQKFRKQFYPRERPKFLGVRKFFVKVHETAFLVDALISRHLKVCIRIHQHYVEVVLMNWTFHVLAYDEFCEKISIRRIKKFSWFKSCSHATWPPALFSLRLMGGWSSFSLWWVQ